MANIEPSESVLQVSQSFDDAWEFIGRSNN
jgi:hypothetical protein